MATARVTITVPQVVADKLRIISEQAGESVSRYVYKAVLDRMIKDTADVLAEYGQRREAEDREDGLIDA